MGSHDGRIAVVTGGGRGIGQEYAVALAADGATVALTVSKLALIGVTQGPRVSSASTASR
jgi:NAD(P)-dependent dehydrogenase (short-subunit alcohol dehydrogenase family)